MHNQLLRWPVQNPFEFGRELGSEELVDRRAEVAAVKAALLEGGKMFLIGPRRFGKTSILRAATDQAERRGAIVLRYDAQAFPRLEQLAARITADTVQRLTRSVERAGAALRDFFAGVRPSASFDPQDGKWSISLGGTPGRETGPPLLADVLHAVERAAAKTKRRVAVVIDEFQEVVEAGGVEAEEQIRAAIQQHERVGYVFAGSKTRMLADMVAGANRPFYRMGAVHFLTAVPRGDFAVFLLKGFTDAGIPVAPDAPEAILDAAEEVPYNVQALAHACWARCRTGIGDDPGNPLPLTGELVSATRDAEALRLDPLYTQLWTSLPSSQRRALLAVLREGGTMLTSSAVAAKYGMPVGTMQRSIAALQDKMIIRSEQAQAELRMRVEDPLFAAWIRLVVSE
jgi:hypothetical protein